MVDLAPHSSPLVGSQQARHRSCSNAVLSTPVTPKHLWHRHHPGQDQLHFIAQKAMCVLAVCCLPQERNHMKIAQVIHYENWLHAVYSQSSITSHNQQGTLCHTIQPSWSSESSQDELREVKGFPTPHSQKRCQEESGTQVFLQNTLCHNYHL